ncbi:MAG: hypothetical protein IPH03_13745 [Tetrasphaera sp.]|nr:hypothetical protein [Tetrasphaera sp.]
MPFRSSSTPFTTTDDRLLDTLSVGLGSGVRARLVGRRSRHTAGTLERSGGSLVVASPTVGVDWRICGRLGTARMPNWRQSRSIEVVEAVVPD